MRIENSLDKLGRGHQMKWLAADTRHNLFRSHCLQPRQQQNSQSGFMVGHCRLHRDVHCRTVVFYSTSLPLRLFTKNESVIQPWNIRAGQLSKISCFFAAGTIIWCARFFTFRTQSLSNKVQGKYENCKRKVKSRTETMIHRAIASRVTYSIWTVSFQFPASKYQIANYRLVHGPLRVPQFILGEYLCIYVCKLTHIICSGNIN